MNCRRRRKWTVLFLTAALIGYGYADDAGASVAEEFDLEPLRDPFWPVGYFPENWQSDEPGAPVDTVAQVNSDWSVPESLIRVTATSRMGSKAAAIINGQIREEGDVIEMVHNNRVYKWKLRKVNSNGTIGLDRLEASNRTLGFQPGDKK